MLESIELDEFRNYAHACLNLTPGITVLYGQNAQGKTNLLEAIHLVSTTRLLRGSRDAEAIRSGATSARVVATLEQGTEISVELASGVRKRGLLNGMGLPRASDLIGRLPTVCFSSADLEIIQGEPAGRRMFLDAALCQLFPRYLRDLAAYKRALEQRNALLRASQELMRSADVFEPWEAAMAQSGAAMRAQRRDYVRLLEASASTTHSELCPDEHLGLSYEAADEGLDAERLGELLSARRSVEVMRGSTLSGPHRDEVRMAINGKDLRHYGSQGQQRSAAISLKLASLAVANSVLGVPPLLLLDDVFAELDSTRQANLLGVAFAGAQQAIITCTDATQVTTAIAESARWVKVEAGNLVQS